MIGSLDIERHNGTHPSLTVDNIGHPAQLLHSFQNATGEKDGAFTVVGIVIAHFVFLHLPSREIVIIVDEVHLYTSLLDGSNLDDERVVGVVDDKIHSR